MKKILKPLAYVPDNAELNFSNQQSKPPKTKYEKRKKTFTRDKVNKLVKGKYGRDETSI